ncbi:MAG: AraC family transcriptional regulator [Gaiellaceae bacterium]
MDGSATLPISGGTVSALTATAGRFTVSDLSFAPGSYLPTHAHELPCLAFVLDGSVDKRFGSSAYVLATPGAVTMPAGAEHADRFERAGARMLAVEPLDGEADLRSCAPLFDHVCVFSEPSLSSGARRLAGELRATDAAAPLALEALVLDVVARAVRRLSNETDTHRSRTPAWLTHVEERLADWQLGPMRVTELADEVGVHPVHLARVFRSRHGMPIGTYVRRLRLDWAAKELATSETALAEIAADAGFFDQSHFTRAFRSHTGLTPARYRAACA